MNEDFKKFVDSYKSWKAKNHNKTGISREEFLALFKRYEKQIKKELSGNIPDEILKSYFS